MKRDLLRRAAGILLILSGVLTNPWMVGLLLSADGTVNEPRLVMPLVAAQLLAVLLGLAALMASARIQLMLGGLLALVVLATLHNLYGYASQRLSGPSPANILGRVLALEQAGFAELGHETSEILYALHSRVDELRLRVPESAVVDTATGIDPWIVHMLEGQVTFEIAAVPESGTEHRLFRSSHTVGAETPPPQSWEPVSVDLSGFAGQEVTLLFKKAYVTRSGASAAEVFDLEPTDLMLWRQPEVRPARLEGKKNVILISIDTLRADHLGYMGYGRATSPNLDRLAERGVVFRQCISQAPWTTPAHYSILTATYPFRHGGNQPIQNTTRWWNDRLPTMAGLLSEHGYATAAFTGGGAVAAAFGFFKGFDIYSADARGQTDVEKIVARATGWVRDNRRRSFFLFLHTYEPHAPYLEEHFVEAEGVDESDDLEVAIARYDGDIRKTDLQLGKLFDALAEQGLLDSTILVVTSDHGEELPEHRFPDDSWKEFPHGHTLYDELLRVPLLVYGIGDTGRVDPQVRSIDILPTLLDYLDLPPVEGFDGQSLRPLIEGHETRDRPAFSEATTFGTERESLRAGGFKYIRRLSYGQLAVRPGLPLTPPAELYDLEADPGERTNLAAGRPEKLEELRLQLDSLIPREAVEAATEGTWQLDLESDPELRERLRALGYVD